MAGDQGPDDVFEIKNGPLSAKICRYGASVMSLTVPDKAGAPTDVVLGFDNPRDYLDKNSPYFGCVVGRVANRIANAQFSLKGVTYSLPQNDPPNTLHGGPEGLHKHLWSVEESNRTDTSVTLRTTSADGDQGFPGEVEFSVTYSAPSSTQFLIHMTAKPATRETPASLAHHMYWNLAGHNGGSILDHALLLNASSYTPVGPTLVPTGEIVPTAGTPFDFSSPTPIGSRIDSVAGGYDHNYVLQHSHTDTDAGASKDNAAAAAATAGKDNLNADAAAAQVKESVREAEGVPLHHVATARSPSTGIALTLHSNAPGVQFYSGNFLDGSLEGKEGARYQKQSGFCLETQGFPNAVNEPRFPSIMRAPGELHSHIMLLNFSC